MKKLILFCTCIIVLILVASCGGDEMPPIDNCPTDSNLGRVDLDQNTVDFISQEMRDSTMIIFVNEEDEEMVFHVSDDNMGQEYLKVLAEKNRSLNCGSESVSVQLIPQEFFLIIESEDERSTIAWKATVETAYDEVSNTVKITDLLTVVASGNIDGIATFVNDKADVAEGPDLKGGGFYPELRIHGVPFKDVYLDQPAVDGVIDAANIAINLDYGIAAFKDRMGFWWRHKDFK